MGGLNLMKTLAPRDIAKDLTEHYNYYVILSILIII